MTEIDYTKLMTSCGVPEHLIATFNELESSNEAVINEEYKDQLMELSEILYDKRCSYFKKSVEDLISTENIENCTYILQRNQALAVVEIKVANFINLTKNTN